MTPQDYGPDRDGALTPARVLDVWRRRKWTGIAIATVVAAGTVTAVVTLPDLYRATATVVVEREVSQEFVRPSVTMELETRIQTIHQLVTSRENLSRIIEELDLYQHLRNDVPLEELVDAMRSDLQLLLRGVDRTAGGNATIAFTVGYIGRDAHTVADVVNTLVGAYVDRNASARERQAARTAEFLLQELEDVRRTLEGQERQARTFALTYTDELPQQLEANLAALERLNSELMQNGERQLRLLDARERLALEVAAGHVVAPPVDTTSPAARLVSLRQQLASLTRTFSDEYPDVKRIRGEIAVLERDLGPEASVTARNEALLDPVARARQNLQEIEQELTSLQASAAALRKRIGRYEGLVESAPRRQLELDRLSRGSEQTRQRYQVLLQQYEDAQLAATLEEGRDVEQFRILDPAVPPRLPSAPNRSMLALMGMAAAFGLAMAGMAAREKLDTTCHTPDDLRDLLPGLAVVPLRRIATRRSRLRARLRFALAAAGMVLAVALVSAGTYYVAGGNEQIVRMLSRGDA